MLEFFFFTLICATLFLFHRKMGFYVMVIGGAYFLAVLPNTGWDYTTYKQAFDASYISNRYPFFVTSSSLTAEPFYLWYSSFWGVVLPFEFPIFLASNFLFCLFISKIAFKKFQPYVLPIFWVMLLPVIFPTIFYFSPRSSISFFMLLAGFCLLFDKKYIYAGLLLFGGCMMHSQYLLIGALIGVTYFIFNKFYLDTKVYNNYILLSSAFLFIFLRLMEQISASVASALSFLPSMNIIAAKMNYFEEDGSTSGGFRATAILSVLVYPFLAYQIKQKVFQEKGNIFFGETLSKQTEKICTYLLLTLMIYGAVINLAFVETPHVAGRLARFSDYVGMGLIIPLFFRAYINEMAVKWIIIFFCLLAPVLYASLYMNVDWRIF